MIIALVTIFGIAALIVAHEWGHFWTAKKFGLKIEEFGIGFPPRIVGRRKGETLYTLNWLPLGGFVKIAGEGENDEDLERLPESEKATLFFFQKPWKRAVVIVAGIVMNLFLGWLILTTVFLIGTPQGIIVNAVEKGSPADSAGLKINDVITGYGTPIQKIDQQSNGNSIPSSDFISFINTHQGQEVQLLVKNQKSESIIKVIPRENPGINHGALGIRLTGIGIPRQNILDAFRMSFSQSIIILQLTVQGLFELVKGIFIQAKVPEGVVGPIGIFHFAYETGSLNLVYLLHLLSLISLNLAVLNLIPFPGLDGGHLLFILIEKIKGSPVRKNIKMIASMTGIGLLLLLMLVLTFRDVQQIFFS